MRGAYDLLVLLQQSDLEVPQLNASSSTLTGTPKRFAAASRGVGLHALRFQGEVEEIGSLATKYFIDSASMRSAKATFFSKQYG